MKCALITLGTSDIAFGKEWQGWKTREEWYDTNRNTHMIYINKKTFRGATEHILKNFDEYSQHIKLPLVTPFLEKIKKHNVRIVYLVCTNQKERNEKDTLYLGEIITKILSRDYEVKLKYISFDPTDFPRLVAFFSDLMNELAKSYEAVFTEVSGGTPQMHSALETATLFALPSNVSVRVYEVKEYNQEVSEKNFVELRRHILRHKVREFLKMYDFMAVKNLMSEDEQVKELCERAISAYNLSSIPEGRNYREKASIGIELIYSNLIVCLKQGRYAEVAGRIWRIEEAVWHLLLYDFLKSKGLVNERDKVKRINSKGEEVFNKSFEKDLLPHGRKKFFESIYLHHFAEIFQKKNEEYYFSKFENVSVNSGKNFYYFFLSSVLENEMNKLSEKERANFKEKTRRYFSAIEFFKQLNAGYPKPDENTKQKENPLTKLRNKSIMGHGLEGVSLRDIKELIRNIEGVSTIDDFLRKLKSVLEDVLGKKVENIFDNFQLSIEKIIH
ncbi:hypothetical protein D6817_03335 [Candidatus Pacearchaeota archaeon]|nr:MAG: hypothetical protein D6817_03335 [Candidatus Pacearchaeota archaeon]